MALRGFLAERAAGQARACAVLLVSVLMAANGRGEGGPQNVLIVANKASAVSRSIAEYYARKRGIPAQHVCYIDTPVVEDIAAQVYDAQIAKPVAACLAQGRLREQILYIVTTLGVPLKVNATGQAPGNMATDSAAVDSELTLLYTDMAGARRQKTGPQPNPFYNKRDEPFGHPRFPMYLVTRLAGYDFGDVRGIIDRSLVAANRGVVVLDLKGNDEENGNNWLRDAAIRLPNGRFVLEESTKVLYGQKNVIGYGAFGSNDKNRQERYVRFQWLPGAIVSEFVSTNGRTFARPPEGWTIGPWTDRSRWFHESPQTLAADYIHEGATGASAHVDEPFLSYCPRPEILFPAYLKGRNLAESYYLAIPAVSWMNMVIGDPLCRLK